MTRKYSSTSTETTLSSGINTTQTTMQVPSSAAATSLLGGQTLAAGNVDIFTVVIDPDTINEEIVYITDVSGDTFTISRGQAGTGSAGVSGIAHSAGATIRHVLTSSDLDFFRNGVATADAAIAKSTLTAKGNILTATASATPAVIGVGTNGQVLTADSTTANGLAWATLTGAPKIGQVVTANSATLTTTNSTSYVDATGLSVSITPTLSTSKILVVCDLYTYVGGLMGANSGGALTFAYFTITRGTTNIGSLGTVGVYSGSLSSNDITLVDRSPLIFLDSPNTTSATTYKVQVKANGTGTSAVTAGVGNGSITVMEVLV
jgi:hypothetical protein